MTGDSLDQTKSRRFSIRPSRAGATFAAMHAALLAYTIRQILTSGEPNWPGYWIIFLAFDFPVSLGVMPVTWLVPPSGAGPLRDATNFWWPALYHGIAGTAWWYIVGAFIGTKIRDALRAQSGKN